MLPTDGSNTSGQMLHEKQEVSLAASRPNYSLIIKKISDLRVEKPITCHLNQGTKAGVMGALPSGPQSDALGRHITSAASLLKITP